MGEIKLTFSKALALAIVPALITAIAGWHIANKQHEIASSNNLAIIQDLQYKKDKDRMVYVTKNVTELLKNLDALSDTLRTDINIQGMRVADTYLRNIQNIIILIADDDLTDSYDALRDKKMDRFHYYIKDSGFVRDFPQKYYREIQEYVLRLKIKATEIQNRAVNG